MKRPPTGSLQGVFAGEAAGAACQKAACLEALEIAGRAPRLPPLVLRGTAFELAVWRSLLAIPFGETRTYGELAATLKRPGAARAVGQANHANPIPILVPCHRVVQAGGGLGGYGGGVAVKRWLLAHEAQHVPWLRPS